jgi:hypothetical protein
VKGRVAGHDRALAEVAEAFALVVFNGVAFDDRKTISLSRITRSRARPQHRHRQEELPVHRSCRRRGLDLLAYLRDVLTRLPKITTGQIPEVTPEA